MGNKKKKSGKRTLKAKAARMAHQRSKENSNTLLKLALLGSIREKGLEQRPRTSVANQYGKQQSSLGCSTASPLDHHNTTPVQHSAAVPTCFIKDETKEETELDVHMKVEEIELYEPPNVAIISTASNPRQPRKQKLLTTLEPDEEKYLKQEPTNNICTPITSESEEYPLYLNHEVKIEEDPLHSAHPIILNFTSPSKMFFLPTKDAPEQLFVKVPNVVTKQLEDKPVMLQKVYKLPISTFQAKKNVELPSNSSYTRKLPNSTIQSKTNVELPSNSSYSRKLPISTIQDKKYVQANSSFTRKLQPAELDKSKPFKIFTKVVLPVPLTTNLRDIPVRPIQNQDLNSGRTRWAPQNIDYVPIPPLSTTLDEVDIGLPQDENPIRLLPPATEFQNIPLPKITNIQKSNPGLDPKTRTLYVPMKKRVLAPQLPQIAEPKKPKLASILKPVVTPTVKVAPSPITKVSSAPSTQVTSSPSLSQSTSPRVSRAVLPAFKKVASSAVTQVASFRKFSKPSFTRVDSSAFTKVGSPTIAQIVSNTLNTVAAPAFLTDSSSASPFTKVDSSSITKVCSPAIKEVVSNSLETVDAPALAPDSASNSPSDSPSLTQAPSPVLPKAVPKDRPATITVQSVEEIIGRGVKKCKDPVTTTAKLDKPIKTPKKVKTKEDIVKRVYKRQSPRHSNICILCGRLRPVLISCMNMKKKIMAISQIDIYPTFGAPNKINPRACRECLLKVQQFWSFKNTIMATNKLLHGLDAVRYEAFHVDRREMEEKSTSLAEKLASKLIKTKESDFSFLPTVEETPFDCMKCDKCFSTAVMLRAHHFNDHLSAKCHFCDEVFPHEYIRFVRHVDTTHNKQITKEKNKFVCYICGQTTSRFREEVHISTHVPRRNFICEICGKTYAIRSLLTRHFRRHNKQHECEVCKRKFASDNQLKRHMRSHTGDQPFPCKYCDRKFSHFWSLLGHHRIHTDNYPYECQKCSQGFRHNVSRKRHELMCDGTYDQTLVEKKRARQVETAKKQWKTHKAAEQLKNSKAGRRRRVSLSSKNNEKISDEAKEAENDHRMEVDAKNNVTEGGNVKDSDHTNAATKKLKKSPKTSRKIVKKSTMNLRKRRKISYKMVQNMQGENASAPDNSNDSTTKDLENGLEVSHKTDEHTEDGNANDTDDSNVPTKDLQHGSEASHKIGNAKDLDNSKDYTTKILQQGLEASEHSKDIDNSKDSTTEDLQQGSEASGNAKDPDNSKDSTTEDLQQGSEASENAKDPDNSKDSTTEDLQQGSEASGNAKNPDKSKDCTTKDLEHGLEPSDKMDGNIQCK